LSPKEERYKKLFLLDGTPVNNLLDITNDVKVLIATDKNDFVGVQFEDVQLTELNKQISLKDMMKMKSDKFSNTTLLPKPDLIKNASKKFFPQRKSVARGQKISSEGHTSKFVPKPNDALYNTINQKNSLKLP
jgi:hypothetical protein